MSDTVPSELEVTATTAGGVIMGLQHKELPLHGVQFHPESVLTEGGHRLLANWLEACGLEEPSSAPRAWPRSCASSEHGAAPTPAVTPQPSARRRALTSVEVRARRS